MFTGVINLANSLAVRVILAAPSPSPKPGEPDTDGLATWLRSFFGPLFLVIVGIVAIFFLFTREITRFVQFIVLAIAISVIFYFPGILPALAGAIVKALGIETS
ncbi:hypothetical protein ACQEU6_46325 [Spirillospora sp. CA-108201]